MPNEINESTYSKQDGIQFLPTTYKGCCDESNLDDINAPSNDDFSKNSQFQNYSSYNFLNKIFMGDIPPNVFNKIQFKNIFLKESIPLKIIQIKKKKSNGGNDEC